MPGPSREEIIENLGPLAALAGVWEGDKGADIAPDDNRKTETTKYRERLTLEPFGPVDNHEQTLWGLRYNTVAFRIGEADSFHEEVGYWLWDSKEQIVCRCFIVPRGVTVLAGGKVAPQAKSFELNAEVGSHTFGISSNPFLDREFKTMSYHLKVEVLDGNRISYDEDTVLKMKGNPELFHHKDSNILKRV